MDINDINKIRDIQTILQKQEETLLEYLDSISEKYVKVLLESPNMLEVDYNQWCPDKSVTETRKDYNEVWYNNFLSCKSRRWKIRGLINFYIRMWEPWEGGKESRFKIADKDLFDFDSWKHNMIKRELECKKIVEDREQAKKNKKIEELKAKLKELT